MPSGETLHVSITVPCGTVKVCVPPGWRVTKLGVTGNATAAFESTTRAVARADPAAAVMIAIRTLAPMLCGGVYRPEEEIVPQLPSAGEMLHSGAPRPPSTAALNCVVVPSSGNA